MTVLASGIILYRNASDGPRLLLLRNTDNGHWGLPKGRRLPADEHEVLTARREVEEETGYSDLSIDADFREEIEYVVQGTEDDGRRKRVVYFLAEAPAGRQPALSEEHDAFRWVDAGEARELLSYGHLTDLVLHTLALLRARRAGC